MTEELKEKSTEPLLLVAEIRKTLGKGASRALRKSGMVPATIYGAGKVPLSIAIAEKELTKYYRRPQYISQPIQFNIGSKKINVLPKSIDLHPITDVAYHADFVFLENKIQKMEVPVVYMNRTSCIGVKRGGYFNIVTRTLTLLCPVNDLMRKIEIDTTNMPIGTILKAKEVSLPKGIELVGNPEFVIASIIGKRGKTSDLDEAEIESSGNEQAEKE